MHSQEQLERLKQTLEETNTELQVKEKELKRLKFTQLLQDQTSAPPNLPNNNFMYPQGSRTLHNINLPKGPTEDLQFTSNLSKTVGRKDTRDLNSTPGTRKNENVDQANFDDDPLFEKAIESTPEEDRTSGRNLRKSKASPLDIIK